jgi:lipopolysaccharide/colanic/teichoic acid biosynthesis glycosyltransferase
MGKNGKEFWLYKFRSMIVDADKVLLYNKKLLAEFKNGDWKLKNDPRITKLGRLLRNLTIDEFPQLYNVLKGEMSIVGPRAYLKEELKEQSKKYPQTKKMIKKILSVKPGITGVWQTSGRNIVPFAKRAKMDYDYVRSLSFWQDLKIILNTPKAMISKW